MRRSPMLDSSFSTAARLSNVVGDDLSVLNDRGCRYAGHRGDPVGRWHLSAHDSELCLGNILIGRYEAEIDCGSDARRQNQENEADYAEDAHGLRTPPGPEAAGSKGAPASARKASPAGRVGKRLRHDPGTFESACAGSHLLVNRHSASQNRYRFNRLYSSIALSTESNIIS